VLRLPRPPFDLDPPDSGLPCGSPAVAPDAAASPQAAPARPLLEHRPGEKALLVLVLFVLTFGGYYAVGEGGDPAHAATLATPLDRAIPLVPAAMYLYAWVYTVMLYPAFVVRCPYLFRRVALAYAVVVAVSLVTWVAFPVTSLTLRPPLASLPQASFDEWGLKLNYTLDPPFNCFPSLHLSIATLAALAAARARRAWGGLAAPIALGIAVAIVAVKQHWVLDGVAGALLGAAVYAVVVHPARTVGRPAEELAYDWRGPAAYFTFHCAAYGVMYALFRAGWQPWAR
jgi:membrane-associated phospholipid phosphatase